MPRGSYERSPDRTRETSGQLVDAGVDWLSLTGHHGETGPSIRALGEKIVAEQLAAGWEERPYPGGRYRGFMAGGCGYGERPEDVALQLTSTTAAKYFGEAFPLARSVSRLDAQVTVQMPAPVLGVSHQCWLESQSGTGRKGRPPKSDLILNSTGGSTAYLGSAKSARFVRVYDKGVEKGVAPPGELWRVEAVLRDKRAMHAGRYINEAEAQGSAAAAVAETELQRKACRPFWSPVGNQYAGATGSPEPATVARKLEWLRAQVSPSVAWLLTRTSPTDVIEALGLSECLESYLKTPPPS